MPAPRTAEVRVTADVSNAITKFAELGAAAGALTKRLESTDGRMANLVQTAHALAPAVVPLGATAIPAITGLTTQLGLAVVAAGTAALAFHGVGTALKAMDTYQAKPTVANLENLNIAMRALSPAGQDFIVTLDKLEPKLKALRATAQTNMFPGVTDGLHNLFRLMPEANRIIATVAKTLGDLADAGSRGLVESPTFRNFFEYIRTTARPVLIEMAQTLANVGGGIANLLMAFDPLSRSFSTGLLSASRSFAEWAAQLSKTKGFEDFVAYIQDNIHPALAALGSLSNALIEIVRAAAPVGHVVLPIITAFGNALASLASTNTGSAIIAIAAAIGTMGRSLALLKAAGFSGEGAFGRIFDVDKIKAAKTAMLEYSAAARNSSTDLRAFTVATEKRNTAMTKGARELGKGAAAMAAFGLAATGVPDKIGLANTMALGLTGTLFGPWGAAIGGGIGLLLDFAHASQSASVDQEALDQAAQSVAETLNQQTGAITSATRQAAAKALADQGVYDAAQRLGVGLPDVTQAFLGNAAAADRVGVRMSAVQAAYSDAGIHMTGPLAKAFDTINAAVITQTGALGSARRHILQTNEALGQNAGAQKTAGDAAAELMAKYQAGTIAVNDFATAVDAFNAILDKRSDYRAYQAAIDDFTSSLKQNGKTLDANTPKGRAVAAALDTIARQALNYAKTMTNAGRRTNFLGDARQQFVRAAVAAGMLAPAARRLAASLGLIKPPKKINVKVDTGKARDDVDNLNHKLDQTGKKHPKAKVTVDIGAARDDIGNVGKALDATSKKHPKPVIDAEDKASGVAKKAQGNINGLKGKSVDLDAVNHVSSVVGSAQASINALHGKTVEITTVHRTVGGGGGAHATGGYISGPGTPTSDSIPAWLSDGEYVIRNAAVERYGVAMFDRLNALHFAGGGAVKPANAPITGSGGADEVARLNRELRELRREVHGARDDSKKRRARELATATKELNAARAYASRVDQGRRDYASNVRDSLVTSPFTGTLGGFNSQVRYESSKLRGTRGDLRTLRNRGLSGALLKDLAASGNAALIGQFADLSRKQIATEENRYNRRNALDRAVGAQAAAAVYPSTTALRHEISGLTREIHALRSGKHIGNTNIHGRVTIRDSDTKSRTKTAARRARHA